MQPSFQRFTSLSLNPSDAQLHSSQAEGMSQNCETNIIHRVSFFAFFAKGAAIRQKTTFGRDGDDEREVVERRFVEWSPKKGDDDPSVDN
jgi:hypothetical protein